MSKGKGPMTPRQKPAAVERDEAKSLGGRRVARSGGTPWAKEDIRTESFLIQHKDVQEQSGHRVSFEELEAGRKNAIEEGKDYTYCIRTPTRRWFLIEERLFDELK